MRIIPRNQIEEIASKSRQPPNSPNYIIETYDSNPELFSRMYNKLLKHSKNRKLNNGEYDAWIAANFVIISKCMSPHPCYYCGVNLSRMSKSIIEHMTPKLHLPGNIVRSCENCDKMKSNHKADYFQSLFFNDDIIFSSKGSESKKIKTKHFVLLYIWHASGERIKKQDILTRMVEYLRDDYNNDVGLDPLEFKNRRPIIDLYQYSYIQKFIQPK